MRFALKITKDLDGVRDIESIIGYVQNFISKMGQVEYYTEYPIYNKDMVVVGYFKFLN